MGFLNSQYVLLLLNEVLVMSLGNVYIMEQLNGCIDESDWYGNIYIMEMLKVIYLIVWEYVVGKRVMDEEFVKKYVQLYDMYFFGWNKDLIYLFMYCYLVVDVFEDLKYFRKMFWFYFNNWVFGQIFFVEIENVKVSLFIKVFVIFIDYKQKLVWLKSNFLELVDKKWNYKKEFVEVIIFQDCIWLFIINRYVISVGDLMKKYFLDNLIK